MTRWYLALAASFLMFLLAACGGEDKPLTGIVDLGGLRAKTVGVTSFDDSGTMELRYVLQESYGLVAGQADGDVTIIEGPAQDLLMLLEAGDVDAVLIRRGRPQMASAEDTYRVVSRVTDEIRGLTGVPVAGSILLTYADTAEQKALVLFELNRMLTDSLTYLDSNRGDVLGALAVDGEIDEDAAHDWWSAFNLLFGDISLDVQEQIVTVWRVAAALGDIEDVPEIDGFILHGVGEIADEAESKEQEEPDIGDRTTLSIGVLDDPSRRAALYAIEQGIVSSETVDLNVTYLSRSELRDAVSARQFDVVEASPLAVTLGEERDLGFVIVSGGMQDLDGAVLVVLDN